MRRALFAVVLVTACGRIDFDEIRRAADGGIAPACAVFGPWSAPQPIAELETPFEDWGSQISLDGLTLYFNSDRGGDEEIYVARRSDRASLFGGAMQVGELGGPASEGNPSVTGDELEIFFDSNRGAGYALYTSTRDSVASVWRSPTRLDALFDGTDDVGAYVTPDGLELYYGLGVPTSTLVASKRARRTDAFAPGVPLAGLAGSEYANAALAEDRLTLYFEIDPTTVLDDTDLYAASRSTPDAQFSAPALVSVSVPGSRESDASITGDGLELVFASDRPGGAGASDLYVATRSCQ